VTAKTPTPHGISRMLGHAGFRRADRDSLTSSGFEVNSISGGRIEVRWRSLSMGTSDKTRWEWLDKYAKTITGAGYAAERDESAMRLIVTSPETEG
jgi:hypothetical protein